MKKSAVISGVGPGLGTSLVRKFASKGYQEGATRPFTRRDPSTPSYREIASRFFIFPQRVGNFPRLLT